MASPTPDRAQQRAAVEQARKSHDLPTGRALLAELEAELLRWDAAELARACGEQTPAQIESRQLEVRAKHSSNDATAAASESPVSPSRRNVTNRNGKVYDQRVPTWKIEDREHLRVYKGSLMLLWLFERADDALPLPLLPALQDSFRELNVTTGGQQLVVPVDEHGTRIVAPPVQQKQNIAPARVVQSSKNNHMDKDSLDSVYAALIEEPVYSMGEQDSGEPSTTCTSTSESSPDDSHGRMRDRSDPVWKELDRKALKLYRKCQALIEAMPKE